MDILVKFSAVDNKEKIGDYFDYISAIFDKISKEGLIKSISVSPEDLKLTGGSPVKEIDEEGNVFLIDFLSENCGKADHWNIYFEFGTYANQKQLDILIQSDNYIIDIENGYLEKLKLCIKKAIIRDWEKILWLIDKDSESLSINLYPLIYKVENLFREFINELMTKEYGITWWDSFVPYSIKNKQRVRSGEYKSKVPAFNNVDERLMSIDIDDLGEIIRTVRYKWAPEYSEDISFIINGIQKCDEIKLKELIENQRIVDVDLWNSIFSKYLPENFCDKFSTFSKDRNHVMHNKLLDRKAYSQIASGANEIEKDLKQALDKERKSVISYEMKEEIEKQRQIEKEMLEESDHECRENDSGVSIRSYSQIVGLFDEALFEITGNIQEELRFRNDISVQFLVDSLENITGELLIVKSNIDEKELHFSYSLDINDEEAGDSEFLIISKDAEEQYSDGIYYKNGEVELDEDSGLYMPRTEDELSETSDLVSSIVEYIDKSIKNYSDELDPDDFAEFVLCYECGEEKVCINEEELPYGTCTNCGYVNKLRTCSRCETIFNIEDEGEYFEEDDLAICPNCLDMLDEE